jgi:hypothetical protein
MVKRKLALLGCGAILVGQGLSSLLVPTWARRVSDSDASKIRGGCYRYLLTGSGCNAYSSGGYQCPKHTQAAWYPLVGVTGHVSGNANCYGAGGGTCGSYAVLRNGCG